jgi:hypothetical protein
MNGIQQRERMRFPAIDIQIATRFLKITVTLTSLDGPS